MTWAAPHAEQLRIERHRPRLTATPSREAESSWDTFANLSPRSVVVLTCWVLSPGLPSFWLTDADEPANFLRVGHPPSGTIRDRAACQC